MGWDVPSLREKPYGATAGVRIGPGREDGKGRLFPRGSCLFPYSLPFSDDLTDGTETGVLIFEVGAYEVDVPLCHPDFAGFFVGGIANTGFLEFAGHYISPLSVWERGFFVVRFMSVQRGIRVGGQLFSRCFPGERACFPGIRLCLRYASSST